VHCVRALFPVDRGKAGRGRSFARQKYAHKKVSNTHSIEQNSNLPELIRQHANEQTCAPHVFSVRSVTTENADFSPETIPLTLLVTDCSKGGKAGEGGVASITNTEFLAAVFPYLPEGAFAAVCSKDGDPTLGGWSACRADQAVGNLSATTNNYIGCSSFYPGDDGLLRARKAQFAACHFLMLDDLGTKVPMGRLSDFPLSWLIETSLGNYQGGILLSEPLTDGEAVQCLHLVRYLGTNLQRFRAQSIQRELEP
jgi:hypothetical protein